MAITSTDLEGQDLIMYSVLGGGYFHDLVQRLLVSANIQPRLIHRLTQIHALLSMVKTGVGMALIPESAARLGIENVICRPLAFGDDIQAELYMAHRTQDNSPLLSSVMAVVNRITKRCGVCFSPQFIIYLRHKPGVVRANNAHPASIHTKFNFDVNTYRAFPVFRKIA